MLIIPDARAMAGFRMRLPVHPTGLGIQPFGIRDNPRRAIFQRGEMKQTSFTGKLQPLKADTSAHAQLGKVSRSALPEVREAGPWPGLNRLGIWSHCMCGGCESSAGKGNELPAGFRAGQSGSPLKEVHRITRFTRGEVIPQGAISIHTEARLDVIPER